MSLTLVKLQEKVFHQGLPQYSGVLKFKQNNPQTRFLDCMVASFNFLPVIKMQADAIYPITFPLKAGGLCFVRKPAQVLGGDEINSSSAAGQSDSGRSTFKVPPN